MNDPCEHVSLARDVTPSANGCEDCLRTGDAWVHLRICVTCGHVGCCDSSPNRHATAHWHAEPDHPVVRSVRARGGLVVVLCRRPRLQGPRRAAGAVVRLTGAGGGLDVRSLRSAARPPE